jgi:uncharacterized membrane protein YccC
MTSRDNEALFLTEEQYQAYRLRDRRERGVERWLWTAIAFVLSAVVVSFTSQEGAFYTLCTVGFLTLIATLGRLLTLPPKT